MRILYLLYNHQDSLTEFSNNPKINLSWVDALFDEILKCDNVTLGLAVPVNSSTVQKTQTDGITLYGLPDPEEKGILIKAYKRYTRATVNININSYIPEVVEDFKPDVIHIFGSENPFGLIADQIKIPVVIHLQGYLFVLKRKWFAGISKWEQFRYASIKDLILMRGCYNDSFTFLDKAETSSIIINKCKYFMGRTKFDKGIVSLISPGSSYYHCEEFIRNEFFERQWDLQLKDEITCISILKGGSYKGIDLLVEAFLLVKKYSDLSLKLKICGVSEDEEICRIIKKKYSKVINQVDIEFLGKLNPEELVNQLCNSNFYIHPSYLENSPNSICEAMALGMPVIATKVGGVSSLINDDVEGIMVQEGEPYAMAGAILDLVKNYEKAKELGKNARAKALKRHSPKDILDNLLKIYKNIIAISQNKDLSYTYVDESDSFIKEVHGKKI
jgi:glycosyltransferase involved in cell wall biosynthesis